MAEDANTGQSVAGQAVSQVDTGSADQNATGKSGDDVTVGGQQNIDPNAKGNQDAKTVPYDRFQEVVNQKNTAQGQVDSLTQQMQVLTANQSQDQTSQQPTDLVSQIIQKLGYQDEPYLSTEQQAHVMNAVLQHGQATAASNQFLAQHSDFAEVVGQNNAAGQFVYAPPLQRILKSNPNLAQALLSSPHAGILAYALASKDPEYVASKAESGKTAEQKQAEEAAALLTQQQGTQSISTVAGQGTMDKAAAIRAMTDDEFRVYKENLMAKAV